MSDDGLRDDPEPPGEHDDRCPECDLVECDCEDDEEDLPRVIVDAQAVTDRIYRVTPPEIRDRCEQLCPHAGHSIWRLPAAPLE